MNLAKAMNEFEGGNLVVHINEMPIKCPVAPLEFIFLADSYFKNKGIPIINPLDIFDNSKNSTIILTLFIQ